MKRIFTVLVAIAGILAVEAELGNSHLFAKLSLGEQRLAAIGLAAFYLAGIAVLAARHRARRQRADDQARRPSGFSAYR
jgi:heme A synthase